MDIGYTWYSHNTITWHYLDQGTLTNHAHDSTIVPAHMVRLTAVTVLNVLPNQRHLSTCHALWTRLTAPVPPSVSCVTSPSQQPIINCCSPWVRPSDWTRHTSDTLSPSLNISPESSCSPAQAAGPTEQGLSWAACGLWCSHTSHNTQYPPRRERERETGTQSGCQLKL